MNAPAKFMLGDGDDAFRSTVVGGSEVAALFDASPYLTTFELFHRKAGNIATPDFGGNERIEAGIRLESAVLEWACDRWGYTLHDRPERLDNGKGLGGHPDALVTCPERGRGILEIKTADWLIAKQWGDEPPLSYLLQVQTYAGLAGVEWGDVIVLVGGNELKRFQYDFRPKIYAEIERRVSAFWRDVRRGEAPKPDYARDLDTIRELNVEQGDETLDLTGDNLAAVAAAEYLAAAEAEREAKRRKDAAQAELIDKLGAASFAFLNGFQVKSTLVRATPDRAAEPGEIIKGRKAYRRLTIKERA